MPNAGLAAYLAKNYLTASNGSDGSSNPDFADSSRPKKKRKKARDAVGDGALLIADDDEALSIRGRGPAGAADDAEDTPVYEGTVKSAEFRKKKTSAWTVVQSGDADDADRILAEAAAESDARRQAIEDEDAPAVVEGDGDGDEGLRMPSGVKAGLQTAADTARMLEQEERLARKKKKKEKGDEKEEETIYRDATGRRIDITMKRAEARAKEEEQRRAEKKAREDAMGDVQRRQQEERRKDLEEAKFLTVARGADDEDMNAQLKEVVRWDDPMAQYMAQKKAEEAALTRGKSKAAGSRNEPVVKKKIYQGHAPPNRYGILPGWRWDGVDRGNGFEKDWFQARGRKARNEDLSYQWQMDE